MGIVTFGDVSKLLELDVENCIVAEPEVSVGVTAGGGLLEELPGINGNMPPPPELDCINKADKAGHAVQFENVKLTIKIKTNLKPF